MLVVAGALLSIVLLVAIAESLRQKTVWRYQDRKTGGRDYREHLLCRQLAARHPRDRRECAREILAIRKDSPVCIVAFLGPSAQIDAVRREHTNFVFRDVASVDEVVPERDVFYVFQEESIRADKKACFVRINALAKSAGTCICFDTCVCFFDGVDAIKRYVYNYPFTTILFRDYSAIPLHNGYIKTGLSPAEYRSTLSRCMQDRFNAEKIAWLVPPHEYIFCYFCATSFTLAYSLSHLVTMVYEMMRLDGRSEERVTVLANFGVNRLLEWNMPTDFSTVGECLEETKRRIMTNLEFVDVDFDQGTVWLTGKGSQMKGPVFEVVSYVQVTEPGFEYLLLRSGEIAGCTGDMSVSQVLSTGRVMAYQCLSHKEKFIDRLAEVWKDVNGHESTSFRILYSLTSESINRIGRLPEKFDAGLFREQYRAFLARLRQDDFRKKLKEDVSRRSRSASAQARS
ncbi:UNVERIFIED_CONTAM: hypothetical protein PYX00_011552 [Menopon gallinae]|uniref:Uncharacterized protein n=1 Tax=Menopon gallinae TaxID=328185 RepID=A0AAW2H7Z0_9NEOP